MGKTRKGAAAAKERPATLPQPPPPMPLSASLYASELAAPFTAAQKALFDYHKTMMRLRDLQKAATGQPFRPVRIAGTPIEVPQAPPAPFRPLDGPSSGPPQAQARGPSPSPALPAPQRRSPAPSPVPSTRATVPGPHAKAVPSGKGQSMAQSGRVIKAPPPVQTSGAGATHSEKQREMRLCLDLISYCTAAERPSLSESPLTTFAALKLLQFVDANLKTCTRDFHETDLAALLDGLGTLCTLGVVFSSTALVVLADLIELDMRMSVLLYHKIGAHPDFLPDTNLFIFLTFLEPCALRQRLLGFCATLIHRNIISSGYVADQTAVLQEQLAALPPPPGDGPEGEAEPDIPAVLNEHWVARLNVDFQACLTPTKRISKSREASLHTAVYESEATYFECAELAYPPFLFSPAYTAPRSTTLLQAHVHYDAAPGLQFQQYRLELDVLCSHDAVNPSLDSLLYVFGQHYWPSDPPQSSPSKGRKKAASGGPKLSILRARQDLKSILAGDKGDAPPKALDEAEDYVFLADAPDNLHFALRFRRKIIIPFFLSPKFPAFLFTLQINHRNRYADVFDDFCDPDDTEVAGPRRGRPSVSRATTSSSRNKDRRHEECFHIKSKHFDKVACCPLLHIYCLLSAVCSLLGVCHLRLLLAVCCLLSQGSVLRRRPARPPGQAEAGHAPRA